MLLIRKPIITLLGYSVISILLMMVTSTSAFAWESPVVFQQDTVPSVSLPYPINDRRGDYLSSRPNIYDFENPSNIEDSVVYDPITRRYTIYEKIGTSYYRSPI